MVVKGLRTLIVGLIQEFLRGRGANFDSQKAFLSGSAMHMLWFNFILGSNFIFLCFKLIIIHYKNTQIQKLPKKQKNIKFEPRIKLNHDTYMYMYSVSSQQVDI